jgi:RnfABCDGE-type electron transport complex D subunit
MMKVLKEGLNKLSGFIEGKPILGRLHPIVEAMDGFFFGTDKTAPSAPHISDNVDIKRYMSLVIVALLPSTLAGIYFYGLRVLAIIIVSYIFGGLTEVFFAVWRKKPIHEGFLVTGLIFPLVLPSSIPLWMVAVGVVFGVFFGKEVFGGTGRNIFNPALVGRVFLSMAFPEYFATMWQKPFLNGLGGFLRFSPDSITSATPLINFKSSHEVLSDYTSLLLGTAPGSIGETFRVGIILGGILLILVKVSDWRIPFSYLLSVGLFSLLVNRIFPEKFASPPFQLLSGGLLFGAFFMATDPVTSPLTAEGKWVCGILLGIFTVLIRGLSGFAEGVMFAILLTNALNPLIDTLVLNVKFKRLPSPVEPAE